MEQPLEQEERRPPSPAASVSREIVHCLKEAMGRGPTKARAYFHDECVVVLLREGHTTSEGTMFKAGEKRAVAQGRVDVSETIRESLIGVIERNTGRRVVGFMSSSQQDPDLISYVFVLESSPVIHGGGGGGSPPVADLDAA